jgi:protein tyrosine phosphatase
LQVQEKGLPKCHPYFPTSPNESLDCGHVRVACLEQQELDGDVLVRRLLLTDTQTGTQHQLEHLQLCSWPDHGVPSDTAGIRHLCARLDELRHLERPFVVHCSAGIGRTGAFICVDVMVQMLREWRWAAPELRSLDVSLTLTALVHCLRQQRGGMVQTADQYQFCYSAILDAAAQLLARHEEVLGALPP